MYKQKTFFVIFSSFAVLVYCTIIAVAGIPFVSGAAAQTATLQCKTTPRKPDKCTIDAVPGDFSLQEVEIVNSNVGDVKKVEIEAVHLGQFPVSLLKFDNLRQLELSSCGIFSLNGIERFPHLEDLSLERNNISEIRTGQLRNPELTELDLGGNEINVVDETAFNDCQKLKHLDLSYNRIQTLPQQVFRQNLPDLETIELQGNQIEEIEGIFNNLDSLLRLDLSGNKLKTISATTFNNSTRIFKLKLADNQLTSIDTAAFASQQNLQSLYLSGNQLKSFHLDVVSEYLIHLIVRNNHLEQLTITTELPEARNLYFDASQNHLQEFSIALAIPMRKIDVSHNNMKRFTANLTRLEFLHLDNNDMQSSTFATLISAKNLTFVTLNDTGIDESQFRQVVQLPKLKHLDVSYNFKLGNLDLTQIEEPVRVLDTLEMNFCGVTSMNVDLVMAKFPELRKFGLLGNPIKYKEVKRINSLLRNKLD